jgi:hypothetical protein
MDVLKIDPDKEVVLPSEKLASFHPFVKGLSFCPKSSEREGCAIRDTIP